MVDPIVDLVRFERYAAPDRRDKKYRIKKRSGVRAASAYKYWNDYYWFGNQGNSPHCVGFSWAHWMTCTPIRQFVEPEGIYNLAQHLDEWEGNDYDGTSVRGGAKVLKALGYIDEYQWTWDVDTMANAILTQGPVVVGSDWYDGMFYPDEHGILHVEGEPVGGHAYLVSGVTRTYGYFRMKNSWSRSWGENGRAWVSFDDMQILLRDQGECCLGIERKPSPT